MTWAASIELCDDLGERLRTLAETRRSSPDAVLQEAVSQYVEREEKRDAFRLDAKRAWDDYKRTGLHLTAAEADAWLARLEAGEDAESPTCHV